eukprot:scaffold15227_cov70-Cyclotella_meneghiniana.AAC.5
MAAKLRLVTTILSLLSGQNNALQAPRRIIRPHICSAGVKVLRGDYVINFSVSDENDFVNGDAGTDDLEDFLNELAEETNNPMKQDVTLENKAKNETSESPYQTEQAVGIGGNSGFTYDVNKLKRNLVQESVRGCKQELLTLLGDEREYSNAKDTTTKPTISVPNSRKDRDDLIEDRLAALVQANPVSTTTDSNLLDGDWSFAFATKSASGILDTSRFLLSKTKRKEATTDSSQIQYRNNKDVHVRGGPWRFQTGRTENPFRSSTRQIFLENLSESEDAHIIDVTSVLGGIYTIKRRYEVFGLTRTALDLDLMESESRLLGISFRRKNMDDIRRTKDGAPLEVQILYLDTDLCVCTTGLGLDGPLHVYTKSDLWTTDGYFSLILCKLRLLSKTAYWISTLESPFRIRQKISKLFTRQKPGLSSPGSVLKAINIGELNINKDGTTKEDPSWDGEDDPFYHLTPSERISVLKTMSLQDIYEAGLKRKTQNKKEKRRWTSREKQFKKPDL